MAAFFIMTPSAPGVVTHTTGTATAHFAIIDHYRPEPPPDIAVGAPVAPRPPAPPTTIAMQLQSPEPVAPSTAAPPTTPNSSNSSALLACIAGLESGGDPTIDTGNGYFGLLQFAPSTWDAAAAGAGYPQYANGRADLAPANVQMAVAEWLVGQDGYSPWPNTSRECGA